MFRERPEVKKDSKKKDDIISLSHMSQERSITSSRLNGSSYFSRDSGILFANNSLCFGHNNKFRYFIQRIISTKIFIHTINILIIINCIFLFLETIDKFEIYSDYYHNTFTIIFTIEMLLKIIAYGFVMEDYCYLRDPWNWVDFIIVISGLLYFIPHFKVNINALRAFRLIRPLRTLSIFPSMKRFINSIFNCLNDLFDIIVILLFVFFFFALLGFAIFDNRFNYFCRTSKKPIRGDLPLDPLYINKLCGGEVTCNGKKDYCLSTWEFYYDGRYFIPEDYPFQNPNLHEASKNKVFTYGLINFNNIIHSLFVVVIVATSEGWVDLMFLMMDGYNYYVSLIYFFFCLVVNYYFMLNLITALLLYNFNKDRNDIEISISVAKRGRKKANKIKMAIGDQNMSSFNQTASNGSSVYSKGSRSLVNINLNINSTNLSNMQEMNKIKRKYKLINFNRDIKRTSKSLYFKLITWITEIKWFKKIKRLTPYHKKSTFGYYCYYIHEQPIVQKFFYLCIILNGIVFAFQRRGISEKEINIHETLNAILVGFFLLEIILALVGFTPKEYFKSKQNIWDFIIVILALFEVIIKESGLISRNDDAVASVLTCLRIIRIFKLFRKWENFAIILDSIERTISRMIDFFFVFILFLFIFALLGYSFFNNSLKYKNGVYFAVADSQYYNFDNFINSLVSVIIIIIGDHWIDLLFDCFRSSTNSKVEVIAFYFLILLFGQIIIMKIFLAYLIEQFEIAKRHFEKNFYIHNFRLDMIYYATSININCTSKKKPINEQIKSYLNGIEHIKPNYSLSEGPFELFKKIQINFITREKKKVHAIQRHLSEHALKYGGYYEEIGNMKIFNFDDVLIKHTNNIQVELFYNDELEKVEFYNLSEYNLEEPEIFSDLNSSSEISYKSNNNKNIIKNKYANIDNIVLEEIDSENEMDNPITTDMKFLQNVPQDNDLPSIKENDYDIVSVANDQKSSNKGNNKSILSSFAASRNQTLSSINSSASKYNGLFSVAPEYSFDEDSYDEEEKSCWQKFYRYVSKASCFIFGKNLRFRKAIHDFVYNRIVSYIIFVLIVTNTILICFDNPWLDPKSNFAKFSKRANQCYTCIFILNASLKMISDGVILDKNAYLRNIINIIDCFCWIIGFLGFFNIATQYRYLRALRSIKPIRILIRSENLSLMMETIIASIPAMINLLLFIFLYIFMFTLLGINIFKGKLERVCDIDFSLQNEEECNNIGGNWIFNRENYANFIYGLKANFELILKDEWVQEMQVAGMKTGTKWVWLFYIIVMFIGNTFILDMILAVIIQEFRTLKAKRFHFALLNEAEKDWIQTQRIVMKFHPKKRFVITGEKKLVDYIHLFFESKKYTVYSIITICLSIIGLIFRLHHESKALEICFLTLDYFCEFLFTTEIILKIWVYKKDYFHHKWNIFDFIVVLLIDITIPIDYLHWDNVLKSTFDSVPLCLRFLRLFEIVKLLSKEGRMRALLDTLLYELPSLGNVAVFASFIFLIYGNIGMNIFGSVPFRKKINSNANFRNFLSACLVLLQVSTGEDWNELMNELAYHDCRDRNSSVYKHDYYCVTYNVSCWDEEFINYTALSKLDRFSCGNSFSYAFFISFVIICPVFIMNLCLVMVIQGFEESVFENEGILPQEYMEKFVSLWEEYDPENAKVVKPYQFVLMMKELQPPIGYNYDRHLVSSNVKTRREKEEYHEFQRIVEEIKRKKREEKEERRRKRASKTGLLRKLSHLIIGEDKKENNTNENKKNEIKNNNENVNLNKKNTHVEFDLMTESNLQSPRIRYQESHNTEEPLSTYRQLNISNNLYDISHNPSNFQLSRVQSQIFPKFTEQFPKNKIYISKNLKFYTSDVEVMQLMNRYSILAYDIYKKDHTGAGQNNILSKDEEEEYKHVHKHLEGHGADDIYIHYIDACFSISKYAVSISKNVSFKKLRRGEVSKYSKKMWEAEYDKKMLKQFFINIERREENSALAKKLSGKRIIDLYNFYKARKIYYGKLRVIKENNDYKKKKKKNSIKRRSSIYSSKSNFDFSKKASMKKNRRSSIHSNLSDLLRSNKKKNSKTSSVNSDFKINLIHIESNNTTKKKDFNNSSVHSSNINPSNISNHSNINNNNNENNDNKNNENS